MSLVAGDKFARRRGQPGIADAYAAMDERRATKSLIRIGSV